MLFEIKREFFDGRVKVISHNPIQDERGSFTVTYDEDEMGYLGLPKFVRELHSCSKKNVIRGLHIQQSPRMSKLIRVTRGSAFLVAVDMNPDSPHFLSYYGEVITAKNNVQIWADADFARGFCALEDNTEIQYKCSAYFNAKEDKAIRWDDPWINIPWHNLCAGESILSERDRTAPYVYEYLTGQI